MFRIEKNIRKLKSLINQSIRKGRFDEALMAITACANILYAQNSTFTDEDLEIALENINKRIFPMPEETYEGLERILFYDAFGLDNRGIALIYIKGLLELGYQVIYLAPESSRGTQPILEKELEGRDCIQDYFSWEGKYLDRIERLYDLFMKYQPSKAFLYTTPYDVVGICVFGYFENKVKRFQINLTDHAFWLGTRAFDCCIEFRDFGASISNKGRGIPLDKMQKLPFYPWFDSDKEFEGFPFDEENCKVLFSGGQIYKTISSDNRYYLMLDRILEMYPDIVFLYAGHGEKANFYQLDQLIKKYQGRVFHMAERRDLYQIMRHSFLYLNTYPITGGLMMQYAAVAGKIPLTLRYDYDADGMLMEQDSLGIVFDDLENCMQEFERLYSDQAYLRKKEKKVRNSVITVQEFNKNLKSLLETGQTNYPICIKEYSAEDILATYISRIDDKKLVENIIAVGHEKIWKRFPILFIVKVFLKLTGRGGMKCR